MPRPSALSKITTKALQEELTRRARKLTRLIELRDRTDREIAELTAVSGLLGKAVAAEAPAGPVRKRRRRKAGKVKVAAKAAAKPAARKSGKRKTFAVTADQFVLNLLKGKALTTRQLGEAWQKAGRGGPVNPQVSKLVKSGKVKREPLGGKLGSNYSLA